jgi:carbon storage regulator CsrA
MGYLVLSRRPGQSVFFTTPDGSRVEVFLLDVDGSVVRMGFKAPQDVEIWRGELQDKVDEEAKHLHGMD